MLKDLILRYSSRRFVCKLICLLGGLAILSLGEIEKITTFAMFLWLAAPLLMLWLSEVGYDSEQRRCVELLKKNPTKEDPSVLLWEGGDASLFRFCRSLISLSTWPFYLVLFSVVGFGGREIVRMNQEVIAKYPHEIVSATPAYHQSTPRPVFPTPQRSVFNQSPLNPNIQRFTPLPFVTPPRFNVPNRSVATPPKTLVTPSSSPASSPAPAVKNQ
jgi:hypothetical protein